MFSKVLLFIAGTAAIALASPTITMADRGSKNVRQEVDATADCNRIIWAKTYALNTYDYQSDNSEKNSVSQSISYFDPEDFKSLKGLKSCRLSHIRAPQKGFEPYWRYEYFEVPGGRPLSPPGESVEFDIKVVEGIIHRPESPSQHFTTDKLDCQDLEDLAFYHMHKDVHALAITATPLCDDE